MASPKYSNKKIKVKENSYQIRNEILRQLFETNGHQITKELFNHF